VALVRLFEDRSLVRRRAVGGDAQAVWRTSA
jgi:hypothetical protein